MLKQMRGKLKNNKGFTLIELIVVVAIIGILLALAVPRLVGYTDMAKETADQQLAGLYRNTISVLVNSGKVTTKDKDGVAQTVEITVSATGAMAYKDAAKVLSYRGNDGQYVTGGNANAVAVGTSGTIPAAPALTLFGIQAEYIASGNGGATPTFQSKAYPKGITITIDGTANDAITVVATP